MLAFVYSVERRQSFPSFFDALSLGYTLTAIAVFPLGKFIRAASMINAVLAAHATSLVFSHLNFQVVNALPGRDEALFTSSAERITTVLSLFMASPQRLICSA